MSYFYVEISYFKHTGNLLEELQDGQSLTIVLKMIIVERC